MVKSIIVFLREMSKKCYLTYYSSGLSEAEKKICRSCNAINIGGITCVQ